ncbi:MAG: glycosyltransferase family 2 protein [Gemmatimonadota bacterium]|nr:UDP-glucose--dolichyl-phosphate glucosyltransferase [Gemmatimonadota bacterium]MDP6461604.1 glycosyltransferase family 2 protein [Gemmatimonadota bacterium]MDP6530102.1 glycosyltransferase family 2 protein [Gemmatimonadota bacterium]MDP6801970.1 glycosyltransferase family 2 protein [Gemmatimonadota bacterium]MDP7031318.1 glycosyltransferase family 2 protein [Gemmatimonadota bacterium]
MSDAARVSVIIPALNEEASLPSVLADIPGAYVREILVVDNGSTDRTAAVALEGGARVIREPRGGYGSACLAGIAALESPDVVVFLDADHSDHAEELPWVAGPVLRGEADLVIGSRMTGRREPGALLPQALLGNRFATRLISLIWGVRFTDLGPFRAVSAEALASLQMADRDFGWTVEMQVKAARNGLRCAEVPVRYRKRIGQSKITGTISGTLRASRKILWVIFREAVLRRRPS